MSKKARLCIVLVVLFTAAAFLAPTYKWYFGTSDADKAVASGSREQIRNYAQGRASEDLASLEKLVQEAPGQKIPDSYAFLKNKAVANYKAAKKEMPSEWSVEKVLGSFKSKKQLFSFIESYYRDNVMALKEKSKSILQLGLDLSGGMTVLLEADMDGLAERLGREPSAEDKKGAIDRAIEILNNRIDRFGITEPQIRKQGDTEINIEIPGAADPERVNAFLMGKGKLNFHIVDDDATQALRNYIDNNPGHALDADDQPLDKSILPAGVVCRRFVQKDSYGIDYTVNYIAIREEVGLDGSHIVDAQVGNDSVTGRPIINFTLDKEGADIFFKLTAANVKKTLSIVLDDNVKAGATIQEAISGGQVRMSGLDKQEASDIALVLRTAALPVSLEILNQQAVGASLGEDSIRQGMRAMLLGIILVIIFMAIYYKGAGLIADFVLILNLFLMVGILSAFNLTLTLTSIAGLILNVGMSVDANVVIFERIKEEYRLGKSAAAAVKSGFQKSFWAIADSNITTFIVAVFMSQLGTGPIQGFAYTLAVGIVTSMFTAIFVSRLIFDFCLDVGKMKKLSIGWGK
ncbi:MAG: protein translocase subunit SecD [Spirochaetia bacterium]|nr:protein translocase subunit SecD [Spirochaetia bacterium]